ncbi:CaiB/BaiF CoA-transferase family protein [Xanthobacter sp. KR7-225]|uniref:CaiB/BaiF CoA transferase family protein n=1 Tax=Xanthobacter sp. KR7-225 TaxID=3156613 RepID=UPI0032B57A35
MADPATGPLAGLRVLEFSAIGPVPLAAMLLADMGADIVCVARPGTTPKDPRDIVTRGRRWVELDLKDAHGKAQAKRLALGAEVLLEGFRPGVMERLGLGPQDLAANAPLVYGRMTGWGQDGPLAPTAGHDINYIAITGALDAIRGRDGAPTPPLNLVGDYAGGAMFLLSGVLAAVIAARASGRGQVVDAAMCDGVVSLLSLFHAFAAHGRMGPPRSNMLDGGAHYYNTYRCADGRYVSVGALEPQFYAALRRIAGLDDDAFDDQNGRGSWPDLTRRMEEVFARRTQAEWIAAFEGSDACFAPVVGLMEAPAHPHLAARGTFVTRDGVVQAAPAPRFSRTPSRVPERPMGLAATAEEVLAGWGAGA